MVNSNLTLILIFIVYLCGVFSLGHFILSNLIQNKYENKVERYIFKFGIGNIIFALLFIYLGILGVLYKQLLLIIYLLPPFVLMINYLIKKGKGKFIKKAEIVITKIISSIRREWLILLILFFILFPLIPYLFLYPVSWDSLAYHLALPKFYLTQHFFPFKFWFPESAYPIGIESLFAYGEVFGDPRLGNLIVFSFLIATVIYLLYGLRNNFPKRVLYFATLIFLLRPILYSEVAISPYVDYPFAFYGFLTGVTLIKFLKSRNLFLLPIISILCFYCFLIKYTGLFIIISVLIVISFYSLKYHWKYDLRKVRNIFNGFRLKNLILIIVLLSSLIPSIYWLARNYVSSGNPVYPYFRNIFSKNDLKYGAAEVTQTIKDENSYWKASYGKLINQTDNALDFTFLVEKYSFYIIIMVLLNGIFVKEPFVKYLSMFSSIFFAGICFTVGPLVRYYFPVYAAISLVFSYLFFYWQDQKLIWKIFPLTFLLIGFIMQTDATIYKRMTIYLQMPKLEWLSYFNITKARKLLTNQNNWDAISYINQELNPKKDIVMVAFDNRLYYIDIPNIYADSLYFFNKTKNESVDEVYSFIKSQKITYILENTSWGFPKLVNQALYEKFIEKYCRKVFTGKVAVVYKIE